MSQRKLFTALLLSICLIGVLSNVLQHPESQYILIGSNATFSCRMSFLHSFISWEATVHNRGRDLQLNLHERADVYVIHDRKEESLEYSSTLTVLISPSNAQSWNGTQLQCVGDTGSGPIHSNTSSLAIYESLTPLSVLITPINTTTLQLSWSTAFPWHHFQIDSFNVNITNINSSKRVLETSAGLQDSMEINRFNLTDTDILQPCTEFNFTVSSVSAIYGESDPSFIIGGFDEEPNASDIISRIVYFQANGTPLVDLEVQLPITVCSYQSINYSIEVREELTLEFLTFGPFTHQGSGSFNYRVTSGLTRNKNYSLSVIVDTVVGDSETSTCFDTKLWPEFSDIKNNVTRVMKNTNTSSCDCSQGSSDTMQDYLLLVNNSKTDSEDITCDRDTFILYVIFLSVLSTVVVLMFIIIITLSVCSCIVNRKKKKGDRNTQKRVMVRNPIYNQGPVYDTIPTTLSEVQADSEVNATSTASSYQNTSSTFTAANAYVGEPHNSSSPLSKIDIPNVSYDLEGDAANCSLSLENGSVGQTVDNVEEAYTLMLPGGTGEINNVDDQL